MEDQPDPGTEGEDQPDSEPDEEAPAEAPVDVAEALENVEEGLGGTVEYATCDQELEEGGSCGQPLVKHKTDPQGKEMTTADGEPIVVPDRDLMDLTMIRFRKHMCREHFTAARKKG